MNFMRVAAIVALCTASHHAAAQGNWPAQPIKFIVPYGAGASGDIAARKLAPLISQSVGGPVIVENRAGATGRIGMESVANAAPDGHTFLFAADVQFAITPALYPSMTLDVDKAFTTIGPVMRVEAAFLAHPKLNVSNIPELVALAKSKPGQISYGSVGIGSTHQLAVELMKIRGGFDMTHVPYRGTAQALPDLLSGEIQFMMMGLPQALPLIRAGSLKALAVGSSARLSEVPDIPTLSESGFPRLEANNYWGLWAPAGIAAPIVVKMRAALDDALKQPEIGAWFRSSNLVFIDGGATALDAQLKEDRAKWSEVIKANKIVAQD
jgi:tripartite-type tricarboxylate transporter receptor subunit TctC